MKETLKKEHKKVEKKVDRKLFAFINKEWTALKVVGVLVACVAFGIVVGMGIERGML